MDTPRPPDHAPPATHLAEVPAGGRPLGGPAEDPGAPIETDRLHLVLVPGPVLAAIDEGGAIDWPGVGPVPPELAATLPASLRRRQIEADPSVAAWLVRGIVVADATSASGVRMAGHLGGHDRPDERGCVEAGYTVAAADRGAGLATEAARA